MDKNGFMVNEDGTLACYKDAGNFGELDDFFRKSVVREIEWDGENDLFMLGNREKYLDDNYDARVNSARERAMNSLAWSFSSYLVRALELGVSEEELVELKQTLHWSKERIESVFPDIEEESI